MRDPAYFARFVFECVSRMDKVVCYEQGGPHHSLVWPEMGDPQWRDAALNALDKSRIKDAKFLEPNAAADWRFIAQRRSIALS